MSSIIVVSDDDDDGDIAFVGSSRGPLRSMPIFIDDDSDDEPTERLQAFDLDALLNVESQPTARSVVVDRKGKGRAISQRGNSLVSRRRDAAHPRVLRDALDSVRPSPSPATTALSETATNVEKPRKWRKWDAESGTRRNADGSKRESRPKEEREALKEQERKAKQLARDAAKAFKEAEKLYQRKLNEVNRLRTSKSDTIREIHLYLSADLELSTSPIAAALPEIRTRITNNLSEIRFLPEGHSPIPGVIRFKRHIQARWDGSIKRWIPLDQTKWEWESSVLVIVTAEEVVDKIAMGGRLLSGWAVDVRLALGINDTDQMIVMITGLQKYYSKSKSLANRAFTAAVRAGLGEGTKSSQPGMALRISKEVIERELVKLQVVEGCFLVHVEKTEDVEDWVYNLAADIAIRPYKLLAKSHLNFAPQEGVKKGSTPGEALELMLQEVQGITPSAAAGIVAEYPTFKDLMEGYERAERRGNAEEMLQNCEIRNLRNGVASGRKLNKALAKRVYHIFQGEDSLALT